MSSNHTLVDDKLDTLDLINTSNSAGLQKTLTQALADKHFRVVAKAATLSAEHLLYDLQEDMVNAWQRFLNNPEKSDPNCIAKRAIARSLTDLDCNDLQFYLFGLKYIQLEPVWGGTVDTAADVRASCAMGLVATGYPRALQELTLLLNDPEPAARLGAVRAIGCGNPTDAELLLRTKALYGDESVEITGECFSQLLSIEPDHSPIFVAQFLKGERFSTENDPIRELAALTLGESRLLVALEYLQKAWNNEILDRGFRQTLTRAAALHRSDDAIDWLIRIIETETVNLSRAAVDALQIYQHNETLMNKVNTAVKNRKD